MRALRATRLRPSVSGLRDDDPVTAPRLDLRPAGAEDLDPINGLIARAVDTWDLPARVKRLTLPSYHYGPLDLQAMTVVCAWREQRLVGVVAWEIVTGEATLALHGLYVDPAQWGQGIGSALLRHAEQAARRQGLTAVRVKAQSGAKHFFARQGFVSAADGEADGYAHLLRKPVTSQETGSP